MPCVITGALRPRRAPRLARAARWATLVSVLAGSGCLNTRLTRLENFATQLPSPRPPSAWQQEVDAILARYGEHPVMTAADPRLEPIEGGITTLAYYGGGLGQKLLDQRIPEGWRAPGQTVVQVCETSTGAGPEAASVPELPPVRDELTASVINPEPAPLVPIWFPTALTGGAAPVGATCDAFGQPHDGDAHLCLFARLALRPESGRPLLAVMHGMFDSSQQPYVERIGAILYALGHSVVLPDMRDHGNTLRAAPAVPATLGKLEGPDLLALLDGIAVGCPGRVGALGAIGVSGGGLNAVRAYVEDAKDGRRDLGAGVIALSPLLDIPQVLEDVRSERACGLSQAVELTYREHLLVAGSTALAFAGGAATAAWVAGQTPDETVAWAALVGAGAGYLTGLLLDAVADANAHDGSGCLSRAAMVHMFSDMLSQRWATLLAHPERAALSLAARQLPAERVSLDDYLELRAAPYYASLGVPFQRFTAEELATEATSRTAPAGRLLLVGAVDDPVTSASAFRRFAVAAGDSPSVHPVLVRHGGHGAMWMVNESVFRRLVARFFRPALSAEL